MPRRFPSLPAQLDATPVLIAGVPGNVIHVCFPPGPALWKLSAATMRGDDALADLDIQDTEDCEAIFADGHPWIVTGPTAAIITISNDGCYGLDDWTLTWSKHPEPGLPASLLMEATRRQREAQESDAAELSAAFLQNSGLPQIAAAYKKRIKELESTVQSSRGYLEWIQSISRKYRNPRPGTQAAPVSSSEAPAPKPPRLPRTVGPEEQIAYLGASATPTTSKSCPLVRLQHSGRNYGNLVIGASVEEITCTKTNPHRPRPLYRYQENAPALTIIRAANFLGPNIDMTSMANVVEWDKSRIVIMGLGSQSRLESDNPAEWANHPIPLKEGTLRLVRYLAKHCVSIGVRGEFTAHQLRLHGVENTRVLGCPSFFAKPLNTLRALQTVPSGDRVDRLLFSSTPAVLKLPENREGLLHFHNVCIEAGGDMIVQTETEILRARSVLRPHAASLSLVCSMFNRPDAASARSFAAKRCFVFTDVEGWRQFAASYDLSVGPRFHGNIVALQAGIPALFLTHDSRTRELTQTLSLPSVQISEAGPDFNPAAAYRASVARSSPAEKYPERLRRFMDFLVENDIPVTPEWLAEASTVANLR